MKRIHWLASYPKSGNTWLKAMISRLYQMRYNLPESKLINTDEFALKNPEIPRLASSNGYYSYEGVIGDALEPDAPDLTVASNQYQRNSPEYLPEVLSALAEVRGESREQVAIYTSANARQVFDLDR